MHESKIKLGSVSALFDEKILLTNDRDEFKFCLRVRALTFPKTSK